MASADPGTSLDKSSPIKRVMSARMASATLASPRAFSSITRSSMDVAKVTPAALTACKSIGANTCVAGILPARRSASEPMSWPCASATTCAGSSISHRSRMVGVFCEVMSTTRPCRTAIKQGPIPSRQTRPAKLPFCAAVRVSSTASACFMGSSSSSTGNLTCGFENSSLWSENRFCACRQPESAQD